MPFKDVDSILSADPRMGGLVVVEHGQARPIELADHHAAVDGIRLTGSPPDNVRISLIVGARFARWWAPISRDRGQFGA